jgi:hypothetical protein
MIVYLIVLLIIVAGVGILFFSKIKLRVKGRRVTNRGPEPSRNRTAPAPKPAPAFLEELRSKDRSMQAEASSAEETEVDLQEIRRKEKEIVTDPALHRALNKDDR